MTTYGRVSKLYRDRELWANDLAVPLSPIETAMAFADLTVLFTDEMNHALRAMCAEGRFSRVLAFNVPKDAITTAGGDTIGSINLPPDDRFQQRTSDASGEHHQNWESKMDAHRRWVARRDHPDDATLPALTTTSLPVESYAALLQLFFLYACKSAGHDSLCATQSDWRALYAKYTELTASRSRGPAWMHEVVAAGVPLVFIEAVDYWPDIDDPAYRAESLRDHAERKRADPDVALYRFWLFEPAVDKRMHPCQADGSPFPDLLYLILKRAADIDYSVDIAKMSRKQRAEMTAARASGGDNEDKSKKKNKKKKKRARRRRDDDIDDDVDDAAANAEADDALLGAIAAVLGGGDGDEGRQHDKSAELDPDEMCWIEEANDTMGPAAAAGALGRHPHDRIGTRYARGFEYSVLQLAVGTRHPTIRTILEDPARQQDLAAEPNFEIRQLRLEERFTPHSLDTKRVISRFACAHLRSAIFAPDVQPCTWIRSPQDVRLGDVDMLDEYGSGVDADADADRLAERRRYGISRESISALQADEDEYVPGEADAQLELYRLVLCGSHAYDGILAPDGRWIIKSPILNEAVDLLENAVVWRLTNALYGDQRPIAAYSLFPPTDGAEVAEATSLSPLHPSTFWNPTLAMASSVCRNMNAAQVYYMNYFCEKDQREQFPVDPELTWPQQRERYGAAHAAIGDVPGGLEFRTRGEGIAFIARHGMGHADPRKQALDFVGFPLTANITMLAPVATIPWVAAHVPLPHIMRENSLLRLASDALRLSSARIGQGTEIYSTTRRRERYETCARNPREAVRKLEDSELLNAALQLVAMFSVDTLIQSMRMAEHSKPGFSAPHAWKNDHFNPNHHAAIPHTALNDLQMRRYLAFVDIAPEHTLREICADTRAVLQRRFLMALTESAFGGLRPTLNMTGVPWMSKEPSDPLIADVGYPSLAHFMTANNALYNMSVRNRKFRELAKSMFMPPTPSGLEVEEGFPVMKRVGDRIHAMVQRHLNVAFTHLVRAGDYAFKTGPNFRTACRMICGEPSTVWPMTSTGRYSNISDRATWIANYCLYLAKMRQIFSNIAPGLIIRLAGVMAAHYHEENDFQQPSILLTGQAAGGKSMVISAVQDTFHPDLWEDSTASTAKATDIEQDNTGIIEKLNELHLGFMSSNTRAGDIELINKLKTALETGAYITKAFNTTKTKMEGGERVMKTYYHARQGARIYATNYNPDAMESALLSRFIAIHIIPPISERHVNVPATQDRARRAANGDDDDDDDDNDGGDLMQFDSPAPAPIAGATARTRGRPAYAGHARKTVTVPVARTSIMGAALHRATGDAAVSQAGESTRDFRLHHAMCTLVYGMIQARVLPWPELTESVDFISEVVKTLELKSLGVSPRNTGTLIRLMGHLRNFLIGQCIISGVTTISTPTFSHGYRHVPGVTQCERPFDLRLLYDHMPPRLFSAKEDVISTMSLLRDPFDKYITEAVLTCIADIVTETHAGETATSIYSEAKRVTDCDTSAAVVPGYRGGGGGDHDGDPRDPRHVYNPHGLARSYMPRAAGGGSNGVKTIPEYDMNYAIIKAGGRYNADTPSVKRKNVSKLVERIAQLLPNRTSIGVITTTLAELTELPFLLTPAADKNRGKRSLAQPDDGKEAANDGASEVSDTTHDAISESSRRILSQRAPRLHAGDPVGDANDRPTQRDPLRLGLSGVYKQPVSVPTSVPILKVEEDPEQRDAVHVAILRQVLDTYRNRTAPIGDFSNMRRVLIAKSSHAALEVYPYELITKLQKPRPRLWYPVAPKLDRLDVVVHALASLRDKSTHEYLSIFYSGIGDLIVAERAEWIREHALDIEQCGNAVPPCPSALYEFMSLLPCTRDPKVQLRLQNEYLVDADAVQSIVHDGYVLHSFVAEQKDAYTRGNRLVEYDLDWIAYTRNCKRIGLDPYDPWNLSALPCLSTAFLTMLNTEQGMTPAAPAMEYPRGPIKRSVNNTMQHWLDEELGKRGLTRSSSKKSKAPRGNTLRGS